MSDQLNPTITLAELYENQDQFLDALMVYQKLLHRKPSAELEEKIHDLKKKIFADEDMQYNPVIEQVFSQEERLKFNILPHSYYQKFKTSLKQPKLDSMDDIEESEAEPIISVEYNKELDKVFREFEEEHKDLLVSQTVNEELEDEPAEIFTSDDSLEQQAEPEQVEEPDASEEKGEKATEEKVKIASEDDFFNVPFEDLARNFREDQQQSENMEEDSDNISKQSEETEVITENAQNETETITVVQEEIEAIEEFSEESDQKTTAASEEEKPEQNSQEETPPPEIDQDELQAKNTEEKINQITKEEEIQPIRVEDKSEDEIHISTDLNETDPDKLTVDKVDEILQSEKPEFYKADEEIAVKQEKTETSEEESEADKPEIDHLSNLNFEPAEDQDETETETENEIENEIDSVEEQPKTEMKFPKRENMEGLSFEEIMARLEEDQVEETEEKPAETSEEVEIITKQKTKKQENDIEPVLAADADDIPDESRGVAKKLKNNLPFEYAEDDITLKELEAELKAEFQRTRKLSLEEEEEKEIPIIDDIPQTDIEPILSDEEPDEKKPLDLEEEITPKTLEKIIASNTSETSMADLKPPEKPELEDDLSTGFEEASNQDDKNKVDLPKTASVDLDDLDFSAVTSEDEMVEEKRVEKPATPDLEDLSFDKQKDEVIEDKKAKQAPAKSDLGDLDKPFDELVVENEAEPAPEKTAKTDDLDLGFDEIASKTESREEKPEPEKESKQTESKSQSEKRFSEYVPGGNESEDEFFSNSFDDIIKQSNKIIRQKDIGFKADDVIKKTEKDDNDKEK